MIRAYAFEVRETRSGELRGMGVAVPTDRYVAFRAVGAEDVTSPTLSDEAWAELSDWARSGDENLPRQPPALSSRIVAAMMKDVDASTVVARRVAAVPVAETVSRMLLGGVSR